ncbi:hypothetical protein [uncultured Algimonas sp.]|uniref:hypothetical protein n=1 Tax=uncultured Algimonas sp. TaxID=1547920 RepID=UPI002606EF3B|nr:hypothetical protein [uncultured Algimonas sp.]
MSALILVQAGHAWASAWNPVPWGGELITGYIFAEASEAIDDQGDRFGLDIYSKRIVQTYGNLGLTSRLALIGTFDWQDTQIDQPGLAIAFSEPSSVSAGLQYQLSRREGHAVALSASYVSSIDLPEELLTLENRESALELRGLWGESRTIYGRNAFAELQLAGRMTLAGRHAGTSAQLTVGADPFSRTQLLAKLRHTNIEPGEYAGFDIGRQSRWEMEASGVYRIRKQDFIELGYTSVVGGRSAVLEGGWKIGYWRKF